MRGRGWWRNQGLLTKSPRSIDAGEAAYGSRFGIAFYTHKLPGEEEDAASFELQSVQ